MLQKIQALKKHQRNTESTLDLLQGRIEKEDRNPPHFSRSIENVLDEIVRMNKTIVEAIEDIENRIPD